jgi:shikimate dehydrogenase
MAAPETDRYAVVGNPVAHSKSPDIHMKFAEQTGQHLTYERLLAPPDGFTAAVRHFIEQGGKGLNVTLPFKLEAHALADSLTERARAAGAVNTLKFADGAILGDNTDGAGLATDIERNAALPLAGKKILLLGAGGAARGVVLPLLQAVPASLTIVNRTADKAVALATAFASEGNVQASDYAQLHGRYDIVINATSASLGQELPPVPATVFGGGALAYDMMYGSEPTVFMRFALQNGARARDGFGMLVEQAAESFFLWRGVRPDTLGLYPSLRAAA